LFQRGGGHIKIIFFTKTLDKSIKIEGFALKMMTFFKEAFQVNRKSYPERVRSALSHAIALLPSIDKGRHGFDGQKCPHTASSPLRIRQYSLRVFPCLGTFLLRQNCKAPASDEFTSDFWLLRRRRADARQGEKGKKRRKDTLAGVFALVNRW